MSDVAHLGTGGGTGGGRTRPLLRTLVGDVLRRRRLEQGRTLAEVARDACVSMPYLSEVERGRKEVSSEVLAAVCDALRIDLADLLADVGRDLLDDRAPAVHLRMVRLTGATAPPSAYRPAQRPGGVVLLAA